jgi:hypothetical protein
MGWEDMTAATRSACFGAFHDKRPFSYALRKGGDWVALSPAGYPLEGIYREHHKDIDIETGATIDTYRPELDVEISALPAYPVEGHLAQLGTVVYRVDKVDPDGEGGAKLVLMKLNNGA